MIIDGKTTIPDVTLDPQTGLIEVSLKRPTTKEPLDWEKDSVVKVRILVSVNGVEYKAEGQASGGVRTSVVTGEEIPNYKLSYMLPRGFFGRTDGILKRLGEDKNSFSYKVEVEKIAGKNLETDIVTDTKTDISSFEVFHNSVAFDAATDAIEIAGDGVLSLSHTSTGSDRGVFGAIGWTGNSGQSSTSCTYGGSGMTEIWDLNTNTFFYIAGYRLVAQNTGSQTVTSTISDSAPDDHYLGVISMTGVDQTTPVGTHQSSTATTNPSITVASVGADDMVVDIILGFASGSTPVAGADQTERGSRTDGSVKYRTSTQLGSNGGVMSWTFSGNSGTILAGVNFKASTGGGGSTPGNTNKFLMLMGVGT